MSMLTGDPRTATVRAVADVRVLEVPADRFRDVALEHPGLIEHISTVVAARRTELDSARTAATAVQATAAAPRSLLSRIQKFLRLP
jgi:CRP-like cAMP-binding protein